MIYSRTNRIFLKTQFEKNDYIFSKGHRKIPLLQGEENVDKGEDIYAEPESKPGAETPIPL